MTTTTTYWAWISAITTEIQRSGAPPHDLIEHIMKHAGPDLEAYVREGKDLRLWAAGMYNLLDLLTQVELGGAPITLDEQLGRLWSYQEKHPDTATPCPVLEELA